MKKTIFVISVFMLTALLGVLRQSNVQAVSQQQTNVPQVVAQAAPANTTPTATTEKTYSFIAQPGDSYTLMARKATQIYGIDNKVTISNAKIVYVETNLTQSAGSPMLDLDQKVEMKSSAVKAWVDKAGSLTAEEEKAWDMYAQMADFNTNNVGEKK